jgi:myo-inositol catabolism protein IolC
MTVSRSDRLFILAMDHRDSLARNLYHLEGNATPAQAEQISAGKRLVFEGLLAALNGGVDPGAAAVLVDERYGAQVGEQARAAGIQLAMPIERSGREWFELEYGDPDEEVWVEHVEEFSPDYVKVLVRDNPGLPFDDRRAQQEQLAMVSARLRDLERTFLLELLVPATDAQKAAAGDDYDAKLRPELTEHVIAEMQAAGVEPGIWKIEGLESAADAVRIVAVAQRDGRDAVRCIVLGRDAPVEHVDRWLQIAAPIDGFSGFAIGRTIWETPLADHLAETITADQLVERVAENYRHFVHTYQGALAG